MGTYVASVDEIFARISPRVNFMAEGCFVWEGQTTNWGYGIISVSGTKQAIHRFVYEQVFGPIPEGLVIDHMCRNKLCVNPSHLQAISHEENVALGGLRKTHCPSGHEYNEENTYMYRNSRRCRKCIKRHNDGIKARKDLA